MGVEHIGAKCPYFIGKFGDLFSKSWAFSTGHPFNGGSIRINAGVFE